MRAGAGLDALTREDALFNDGRDMASVRSSAGGASRPSNLGDLGDAAETDRTCATGAPYCLPLRPLNLPAKSGSVVGIEWGDRGGAAGDIEDLASRLFCRRADRDFACRDPSDRGIAPERRNAEYESC